MERWNDGNAACCNMFNLDKNLSLLQRSSLNLARGNRKLAQDYLNLLLMEKDEDEDLEFLTRIRGMIMMAHTLVSESFVSPEAITILNKASILAKEKYLDYEHSIAEINLAYILLRMAMPQQALKIVKSHLENVLSNGGIYDKAKTIFLFVQSLIAASETKDSKLERLNETWEMLTTAIEYFTKLECYNKVKSVYYYLAKLYHELSMVEERNKFALKFRLTSEQYTNNCNENFNIFY
jgi:anaphase-promoting complex subunit 5